MVQKHVQCTSSTFRQQSLRQKAFNVCLILENGFLIIAGFALSTISTTAHPWQTDSFSLFVLLSLLQKTPSENENRKIGEEGMADLLKFKARCLLRSA